MQGDVYAFMRKNNYGGKGMTEDVAVPLILQPFLSGLDAIHRRGLIHRDIKVSTATIEVRQMASLALQLNPFHC